MPTITDSLTNAVSKTGIWTIDKEWNGVTDPALLRHFTQTIIPRLNVAMRVYRTKVVELPSVDGKKYARVSQDITLERLRKIIIIASELEAVASEL